MDRASIRSQLELEGCRLDQEHLAGQTDHQRHSRRGGCQARDQDRAAAIVVSNHVGRQLDGAASSVSMLPRIAEAVGSEIEVIFDGGIRSGQDIMRALALGARGCLIGRAYIFGLGAGGQAGVATAIEIIRKELDVTMALTGVTNINEIDHRVLTS
jgi:L-lactate dehydrogenase (cytochrome)